MSPREQAQRALLEWLDINTTRWTAPYGIIAGTGDNNKYRAVTFGIARALDATVRIYSPTFITLRDSRYGTTKHTSIDDVIKVLAERYL